LPPVLLAGGLIAAGFGPLEHPLVYNGLLAAVFLFFCWACIGQGDAAEARFGRKDPSQAVADETAGQCLSLLVLPGAALATPTTAAFTLAYAFICFRVLDILKPWPAYRLQSVPGGWGILLDDLFAGLYAAALVQVTSRVVMGG
jgi:phosphatidylglycerophosphatase A